MLPKFQAILSSLLIIAGLLLPGIGTVLAAGTDTRTISGTFVGYVDGNTVYDYELYEIGNPPKDDISHTTLVLPDCLAGMWGEPGDGSIDELKNTWVFKNDNSDLTFTVTYPGLWEPGTITAYIKGGDNFDGNGNKHLKVTGVDGPSCTSYEPAISVTKHVAIGPDTQQSTLSHQGGGVTATYYYEVTNDSDVEITLTSAVDEETVTQDGNAVSTDTHNITFTPTQLEPGESTNVATLDRALDAVTWEDPGYLINNTITVTGTYTDRNPNLNNSTQTVTATDDASVTVTPPDAPKPELKLSVDKPLHRHQPELGGCQYRQRL